MTRSEFGIIIAYLEAGCGKSLPVASVAVYFDCLGDLSAEVLRLAARRVLLEHRYATFPSIAELREAAALTAEGRVTELSGPEAWELAWRAIGRIDPEVDGSIDRATAGLPASVVEAIRAMGIPALCYGDEPVGVIRGQFLKSFEAISRRAKREGLLPPATRRAIAQTAAKPTPHLLRGIGVMADE